MTILDVTDPPFGAKPDGSDATPAIQSAIDIAAIGDTVRIPSGTFMINALARTDNYASGGIFLKSDMNLFLSSGAILRAFPNRSDHYVVVTIKDCVRTRILGSGGSIVGDRDSRELVGAPAGQWGFGVSVWGTSRNITVQNITIAKCWGDGLTVIGVDRLLVDQVVIDGCRRQNMSVVTGRNIIITDSTFKNAQYSGLDLECDLAMNTISYVLVTNCSFTNSVEGPAHIGIGSPVGTYRAINIKDCQFDLRMQPIFAHDKAGDTGTSWWAFLLNRMFHQGLHLSTYRFVGYPQSWQSKT